MVELQIINRIIMERSLEILSQNNITIEFFQDYKDEMQFILDHFEKFGNVPDRETMAITFEDFDFLEVFESNKFLIEKLNEQYLFSQMLPFVNNIAELMQKDSNEALNFALAEMDRLNGIKTATISQVYDLVKNAKDRLVEHKKRKELKGMVGITTGLPDMDEITHGWLNEDFVVVAGRPNQGKSWILLFFLIAAWKAGKKVLLYSGEMSELLVGYRFDALVAHFSNKGLLFGNDRLGSYEENRTVEDYEKYIEDLANEEVPFLIITPKMLGNRKLTVPMLHNLIEKYNPDIVGIDQLSLMEDARSKRGDSTRIRYTNISEDLAFTTEKYQIPILADAQAGRTAVDTKKKKDPEAIENPPELEDLAESDGIGQFATRAITLVQTQIGLVLGIKKNRHGENNKILTYFWQIDTGVLKMLALDTPAIQEQTQEQNDETVNSYLNGADVF